MVSRPARRITRVSALALILMFSFGCGAKPAVPPAKPAAAPAAPAPAAPAAKVAAAPVPAAELGDLVPKFKVLIPAKPYFPEHFEACNMLAAELEKLGFTPEVSTHPNYPAFVSRVGKPYDWGLSCENYVAREDRLEPDQLLATWVSGLADSSPPNFAGYKSADFDKAIADQRAAHDQKLRQAAVFKAQEFLARDLPVLSLYQPHLMQAYNKAKFGNVVTIPGVGLWNDNNFSGATPLGSDTAFRVAYPGEVETINPLTPAGNVNMDLVRMVWEPLADFRADGTIIPTLAEKWEAVSPTSVKVTVRAGHRFHDGQPFTARDVAFSYGYMQKWNFPVWAPFLRPIAKVEATDDRTVVFTLKEPYSPIYLTFASVPILPAHIWENLIERQGVGKPTDLKEFPKVGSGPFRWESQTRQVLRLARNDQHFQPPKVSAFLFIGFGNREAAFLSLISQEAHFQDQKGLFIEQLPEAQKTPYLGVVTEPSIHTANLYFNMREGSPFAGYAVREAVAHAINYQSIVRDILKGYGEPGRGIIAPANKFWHNAAIPSQETAGQVHYHQYDTAKAKKILQDAGFGWDKDGKLHYPKGYKPAVLPAGAK